MISAGELNRRITINRVGTVNDHGIAKRSMIEVATVWARMRALRGQENYSQEQTTANIVYEFVVLFCTETKDIKPKDTITFANDGERSLIYEITEPPYEMSGLIRRHLVIKARLQDANA